MTRIASFFVHPEERRLRAPFRFLVYALALAGCAVPAIAVGSALHLRQFAALLALNFVVIVPSTVVVALLIDRRSLRELGVPASPGAALGLGSGTVVGAGLIGGIALVEEMTGLASYTFAPTGWPALVLSLAVFGMVAIHEELLFRGYVLTNLAEAWGGSAESARRRGITLGTLVTSLGFAAAHLFNPHMTWLGVTNIALAGVMLALPYVLRGDLGISIGLHFGWNLAQSWLGMAVSGNDVPGRITTRELHGAAWITGGEVGAEGGFLGLSAIVLGCVISATLAWRTREAERAEALGQPPLRTREA